MEELGLKTIALIYSGACLSIGFWGGKKLTNKIDEWLFQQSDEYKQLVEKMRKENQQYNEPVVSL